MELLLNLIWMAVAILLCLAVWRHRLAEAELTHPWKIAAIAVVCIAALIFPTISLSDDLHLECAAVESPSKRILQMLANVQHTGVVIALWATMLLVSVFAQSQKTLGDTTEAAATAPLEGFLSPCTGRAPPFLPV